MEPEKARGAQSRTPHTSAAGERHDRSILALDRAAIDARDAAAFVGISRAHWLRLVSCGRAPRGLKLGARRVWSTVELAAWIEAGAPPLVKWEALRERGSRT